MKHLFTILIFAHVVTCHAQDDKVFTVKVKNQGVQLYPDIDTLISGTETAFNISGMDIKKASAILSCGATEMSDKSVWLHINAGLPPGKKCLLQLFSKGQTMKLVYQKSFVIMPFPSDKSPIGSTDSSTGIQIYWNNILLRGKDTLTKRQLLTAGKAHLAGSDDPGGFHFVSSFNLEIESGTINKKFSATAPALKGELLQTLSDLSGNYKIKLSEITFTDDKRKKGPFVIWVKN